MAHSKFSMVISKFYYKQDTSPEETHDRIRGIIEPVLEELDLGELNRIDVVKTPYEHFKVFIHYSSASPNADRLRRMLDHNELCQKEGAPIRPVNILYEKTHDMVGPDTGVFTRPILQRNDFQKEGTNSHQ